MTSSERAAVVAVALLAGCGGGGGGGGGGPVTQGTGGGPNVLQLSVNGERCGGRGAYADQPCVQVTVCQPGSSSCVTVDDVLLDTGSYGLRLFRQALGSLSLPQVAAADGGGLATCVQFADLSSDWGPVARADVVLGGEPPVQVPIHVLDATYGPAPDACPSPESGPDAAGFNGILGLGVFPEDCGQACASDASTGIYWSCRAGGCTGAAAPVEDQVANPVARLPQDSNGIVLELPGVDPGGAPSVEGRLLLGVGTQANNAPDGLAVVPLDPRNATFTTTLGGLQLRGSFLDTGSNGLFFAAPVPADLPACAAPAAAWYCPATRQSFTASNAGTAGGAGVSTPFAIDDFLRLARSGNRVFSEMGGPSLPGAGFDWGLPFFLGRRVALGYEGSQSPLGPGPLAAY